MTGNLQRPHDVIKRTSFPQGYFRCYRLFS
jgi:hypothetical protein